MSLVYQKERSVCWCKQSSFNFEQQKHDQSINISILENIFTFMVSVLFTFYKTIMVYTLLLKYTIKPKYTKTLKYTMYEKNHTYSIVRTNCNS